MAPSRGQERQQKKQIPPQRMKPTKAFSRSSEAYTTSQAQGEPVSVPVPLSLQQSLLAAFTCIISLHYENSATALDSVQSLSELAQIVKGHLYNRDFHQAFGNLEYLRAYAVRWSASRMLGYVSMFAEVFQKLSAPLQSVVDGTEQQGDELTLDVIPIACLGGGAGSELIALAGLRSLLETTENPHLNRFRGTTFNMMAVDVADWSEILESLYSAVTRPQQLSNYASAAARAANQALISPAKLQYDFHQFDLLSSKGLDQKLSSNLKNSRIITILFTLNELYTTSISNTQTLLLHITSIAQKGTLLLVVDSPGSYSTVQVNKSANSTLERSESEKKYPMRWLLEYTLFTQAPKALHENDTKVCWETLISTDSKWFRLPPQEEQQKGGLKYPIELEDMRVQLHLYRRIS